MDVVVLGGNVYLVNLDPTTGSEIRKTRSCLVISPDEMNAHIAAAIVAPITTKERDYPTRVNCQFQDDVFRMRGGRNSYSCVV